MGAPKEILREPGGDHRTREYVLASRGSLKLISASTHTHTHYYFNGSRFNNSSEFKRLSIKALISRFKNS